MSAIQMNEVYAQLVAKAAADPVFRESLLTNPRLTIEAELARTVGEVKLPQSLEIKVVEDTPNKMHLVLPANREGERELSEAELETVSGGGTNVTSEYPPTCCWY